MSKTFYHSTILDFMHQDQRGHWVSIYLEVTDLTHKSRVWILVLDPFNFQVFGWVYCIEPKDIKIEAHVAVASLHLGWSRNEVVY